MEHKTRWILVGACTAALVVGGAGLAIAAATDDDQPLTGSSLQRATDAALAHTGGGTVIETEVGDDGAAFGVEVRLPNGEVVEVSLDSDYQVTSQVADDDAGGDESETSDD